MESTRQLVVLCDGTSNNLTGRKADTHVVLLAEVLRQHPDAGRLVYYDPGVGNPGQLPGTTVVDKLGRLAERLDGLAFGRGVFDNIAEGYGFLMRNWRPGDQIWLFGFSRGAFTARSIAGLVNAFGILGAHLETLMPSLVATYFSTNTPDQRAIRAQVARLFAQGDAPAQRPVLHFVGVWDTVASVGLPPFNLRMRTRPDLKDKHFRHVRQALALDEQRAQFRPRAYAEDDGPVVLAGGEVGSVQQRWFRGSHCDVGGGYQYAHSELARAPFAWMLAEAASCGLRLPNAPQPLQESDVLALLAALDPPDEVRDPVRLSSETWATPVWAVTGLAVRDTTHAAMDDVDDIPVKTGVHPSVSAWPHAFPHGTVWTGHWSMRQWVGIGIALLIVLGMAFLSGLALTLPGTGNSSWTAAARHYLSANVQLQVWQANLATSSTNWLHYLREVSSPGRVAVAILWDFLFIGAWGFLLAHAVTPAFAFLAGLARHGKRPQRLINMLGWMLPVTLVADLCENLLALLTLGITQLNWVPIFWPLRVLVFAASLAKWVGLLGVLLLVAGGAARWLWFRVGKRKAPQQPVAG